MSGLEQQTADAAVAPTADPAGEVPVDTDPVDTAAVDTAAVDGAGDVPSAEATTDADPTSADPTSADPTLAVASGVDADDGDAPAPGAPDGDDPPPSTASAVRGSRRWWITAAVAAAALVVGAVLATLAALAAADARAAADDRDQALSAATAVVDAFISIEPGNAPDNIARMTDLATDPFRSELASFSEVFGAIVTEGEVRASGGVDLAAIERIDEEVATVIVGASTTVRNVEVPDGEPRNFRLVIGLRQEADRWLVASVEVAP